MSGKFSEEIASPAFFNVTDDTCTTTDQRLSRRMLSAVGTAMYSSKYTHARQFDMCTSSSKLAVDVGRMFTHPDRNFSYSTKKRPAVTISSSQPQAFRKKKVGFDAEQCGFLRINDIILTISGNVTKTYEQISANSDRSAFLRELAFAKIQSQENSVNWNQLKKLSSSKERRSGYVSEALATYLRVSDKPEFKKQSIEKQLLDIDNIIRDDSSNLSFLSDRASSLSSSALRPPTSTGPQGLWSELKKKGFKEVKHSKSLFEMLVPEGVQGECSDLKRRRKSAMDPDSMFDNDDDDDDDDDDPVSFVDSMVTYSVVSDVSGLEQRSESGKRHGRKKYVTIVEQDGTIHSPNSEGEIQNIDDHTDTPALPPLILITPPSSVFGNLPVKNDTDEVTPQQNGGKMSHIFPVIPRKSGIVNVQSSRTEAYQSLTELSNLASGNNNSSNLTSGRYARSRNRIKNYSKMFRPAQSHSSTNVAKQEERNSFNLPNNSLDTGVVLTQCQLLQAEIDIERLRQENYTLKRKRRMLQLTKTRASDQKTHSQFSIFYEYYCLLPAILSCLTAIFIGIILGKFII